MIQRATYSGLGSYRDMSGRRSGVPRTTYVLGVSGALAVVTFALIYLTTLSFATGL